jgi:hypothetical protein
MYNLLMLLFSLLKESPWSGFQRLVWEIVMQLTEKSKNKIDNMSLEELLRVWRFAPLGDPWMEGETGDYISKRMKELKKQENFSLVSKRVGWHV